MIDLTHGTPQGLSSQIYAMDLLYSTLSGSEQRCLAIIELPSPVDSTFRHHASGIVPKVVSEVDEMGLFHQLGYENREGEWS